MRSLIARIRNHLAPALTHPAYYYDAALYNSQRELAAQRVTG